MIDAAPSIRSQQQPTTGTPLPGTRDKLTADLTRAMAGGSEKAMEAFYEQYFDILFQQARRTTRRDEAFCLDVVQEAVLRVIRTIRPVDSAAQLAGWLRLVVRTTAYDLLKAERRRRMRELEPRPQTTDAEQTDEDQLQRLRQEIARLDPELARMIELRFERQWTLSRIAGLFGLSVGTIDGRLRRALVLLRQRLTEVCDE